MAVPPERPVWESPPETPLLRYPPEGMSYADGTNIADDDLVVGYAVASGSVELGLRWRNGIVQNLNNLVPVGTTLIITAEDVSDNGLILCTNESTYSDCLLIPL